MTDLNTIRAEIDETDDEILRLFEKRMKLTEAVAMSKIESGRPVFDSEREQEKLQVLSAKSTGDFNKKGTQELFKQIMSISRKRQYQLLTEKGVPTPNGFHCVKKLPTEGARVVFQGVEGAYSFAAMNTYFGQDITSFHVETWKEAMDALTEGTADYAVLPIENSTAGIVADIYDLLASCENTIVGEQVIPVDHVLVGLPGSRVSDIRTVYSHPQALMQCKDYIQRQDGWTQEEQINTAIAVRKVRDDGRKDQAAIASRHAAAYFGLEVLDEKITSSESNATRFVIVSHDTIYTEDADKVSICVELPHAIGRLYDMLAHIIYNNLNMTKIESRPIPHESWEYRFFIDFEGNLNDNDVKNALRGIEQESVSLRILGNY